MTFDAVSLPFATWYSSTARSFALSFANAASVALGTLANAASVGAKTVNRLFPESVSTRPAWSSSAARVLNCPAPTAVSTMFFSAAGAPRSTWTAAEAGLAAASATAEVADTARMLRNERIADSPLLRDGGGPPDEWTMFRLYR